MEVREAVAMVALASAPSGTVTFLFTDIEGSTERWETEPDAMTVALEVHDSLLRSTIEEHQGYVFSTGGDGFGVAFGRAQDALAAAERAQAALADTEWATSSPIRVRMGIHLGEVQERDGDYFGPAVNRAARLMSAGHGGQTLVSDALAHLVGEAALTDLGMHRLKDLAVAQRVWQVGRGSFGALRSLDVAKHNLPVQRTELIGREEEIAALAVSVADHRLVTITGIGGTGKTRLALAVAAELMPSYDDGAFVVELAPLSDDGAVGRSVAEALSIQVEGSDSVIASRVGELLSRRDLVLVLDNAEHVLDETAEFVDELLEHGDRCHVMVTSREPLDVEGEHIHRISSVEPHAGARILLERAQAAGAVLDEASQQTHLEEISSQLDGIPLALELAAGQLVHLTPSDLLQRLNDRFSLLVGGRRRRRQRQQTLSAVLDWSWEQLEHDHQSLLSQLSAFHGGWTLGAAEVVCRTQQPLSLLLGELVRSNLVTTDGSGRYGLLETIRLFAQDRLVASGQATDTRARHLEWCLDLSGQIRDGIQGADELDWVEVVDAETANLAAAMTWSVDSGDADAGLELAENLENECFLRCRTDFRGPISQLTELLTRSDPERAPLGFALATFLWVSRDDPLWDLVDIEDLLQWRDTNPYLVMATQCYWLLESGRVDEALVAIDRKLAHLDRCPPGKLGQEYAWAANVYALAGHPRPDLIDSALAAVATEGAGARAVALLLCGVAESDLQLRRRRLDECLALADQERSMAARSARYHLALLDAADPSVSRREALESVRRSLRCERDAIVADRANALHYLGRALALRQMDAWALFAWTVADDTGILIVGSSRDVEQLQQLQNQVHDNLTPDQRLAIQADAADTDLGSAIEQLYAAVDAELGGTNE